MAVGPNANLEFFLFPKCPIANSNFSFFAVIPSFVGFWWIGSSRHCFFSTNSLSRVSVWWVLSVTFSVALLYPTRILIYSFVWIKAGIPNMGNSKWMANVAFLSSLFFFVKKTFFFYRGISSFKLTQYLNPSSSSVVCYTFIRGTMLFHWHFQVFFLSLASQHKFWRKKTFAPNRLQ